MDKRYIIVKLDGNVSTVIRDKATALSFDESIDLIRDSGHKNRMVDLVLQVAKAKAYAQHLIVITHIMGMPGLREAWALLPKHTYLASIWDNYFKLLTKNNEDLSKLPERYILRTTEFAEIKHD